MTDTDNVIRITFEKVPNNQQNELAKELRHAILDSIVEYKQKVEIDFADPDPNQAGGKGDLLLRSITHLVTGVALDHGFLDTALTIAIAEAMLATVERIGVIIKLKCPKSDELEINSADKDKISKWLKKCFQQFTQKNDDDSQK